MPCVIALPSTSALFRKLERREVVEKVGISKKTLDCGMHGAYTYRSVYDAATAGLQQSSHVGFAGVNYIRPEGDN
jgi:hypothetical protein